MQTKPFRIGTRGSPLALAQASETRARLMAAHGLPEDMFEIVVLSTTGDRITDRSLSELGGKGLFTQELEEGLISGDLDFAVHSSKDMPTKLPDGLRLAAYLPREDFRDAFIGRTAHTLAALPDGATVGSSSLRRQALIRRIRPDINVITFRGLVETRLRKLSEGQVDATLLAYAGLKRLARKLSSPNCSTRRIFRRHRRRARSAWKAGSAMPASTRFSTRSTTARPMTPSPVNAPSWPHSTVPVAPRSAVTPSARAITWKFSGLILTPDGRKEHSIETEGKRTNAEKLGRQAGEAVRAAAGPDFFEGWS